MFCKDLPQYVYGTSPPPKTLPSAVCKICLTTNPELAKTKCKNHGQQTLKAVCNSGNVNFLLCPCAKHSPQQKWFRASHDPSLGFTNIEKMKSATLSTPIRANVNSTNINPCDRYQTSLNHCPLGQAACPAEIISVPLQDGTFVPLTIMYDSGSQHSIANAACHPLVLDIRRTAVPLEFATLNGCTSKVREVVSMKIGPLKSIEAIVVKRMEISSQYVPCPKEWKQYADNWAHLPRSNSLIGAQLLLGADKATWHPTVVYDNGMPVETQHARLMRSAISGQYLLFGHGGLPSKTRIDDYDIPFIDETSSDNEPLTTEAKQPHDPAVFHTMNLSLQNSGIPADADAVPDDEQELLQFLSELGADPVGIPSFGEIVLEPMLQDSDIDMGTLENELSHPEHGFPASSSSNDSSHHNDSQFFPTLP